MTAMKDLRIGIVGGGVVGAATARAYAGFVREVPIYDVLPERRTSSLHEALCDTDLAFLCLPTPQKEGSLECDTSFVEDILQHCGELLHGKNLVLKSTVPIGFTRRMRERYHLTNLVHSPEFLTARTATEDAANPNRNIIGAEGGMEILRPKNECLKLLMNIYSLRWPHVPILTMSSEESEAVKLIQNSFSAVKISFFNEMRCLTDKLGLDWDAVLAAVLAGGWISPMHTQVPGPDGRRGWGGSCLPKDLANLISCYRDAGFPSLTNNYPVVLHSAHLRNQADRLR